MVGIAAALKPGGTAATVNWHGQLGAVYRRFFMEHVMTEKDQNQEQPKSTRGAQSPMEIGMGMAKKMMA